MGTSPLAARVESTELRKWPLTHGTLAGPADLAAIRERGLKAGAETNSCWFDEVLGRTAFVFLAPANIRFNYGFGIGILVDPAVLQVPGIRFSILDVRDVVECVKVILEHGVENYIGTVPNVDALAKIVGRNGSVDEEEDQQEEVRRVVSSTAFHDYYLAHHLLGEEDFFDRIEQFSKSFTLSQYFQRTGVLPLGEILIPSSISGEHLLGHWDGEKWTAWVTPQSSDTRDRLQAYIELLTRARR
jgi:hypothetical protein